MNAQQKNYTEDQIKVLSGQIRGTRYLAEVKEVLADEGKTYADGYIHRVIAISKRDNGGQEYNEDIWDAVVAVIRNRQKQKAQKSANMASLALS